MSSQSSTATTSSNDATKVNDSKEVKEHQQSRKRKEPSLASSSSSIIKNDRDSSKDSKVTTFDHDNACSVQQQLSSSASSSSSSSSSLGASTSTYYQMATSKKAAHELSKLHFHAERGPFPIYKHKHSAPSQSIMIVEWMKDGARMVDSIHRLKKDFYPIAYDASKKEVLFKASQNEFYIRETEAGRKYKDWFHIQKHVKQVLEKNAADQLALKEKALEQNGYSQELKNEADALLAEEVLMQSKVRLPQPERPAIIQEAITIMSEMRLPLGLYACSDDDDDDDDKDKQQRHVNDEPFNRSSISSISTIKIKSISSDLSDSSSSFSSSSLSSSSSASIIAIHHARPPQIKPVRTYEIRLPALATELMDEERMEYKVQVESWDKNIHQIEDKSGFYYLF